MAAHKKKTRDLHASLVFTDESGFLLMPLMRATLARIGHTPDIEHRARHRDKVSAAAALLIQPGSTRPRLFYQTFPDAWIDASLYGFFLHGLLATVRGPLVLVHDNGNMHRGQPVHELRERFPRLHLHNLPPYAPELNPVEALWNWCKDKELSNFTPHDLPELDTAAVGCMENARTDQERLQSFFLSSHLSWNRTGFF